MKHIYRIFLSAFCCLASGYSINAQCSFSLNATPTPVNCVANNTGSIQLTVTNGIGPFSFLWSNNSTTEDLANLTTGTYTVTVTDALACTATIQATVGLGPVPVANAGPDATITCWQIQTSLGGNNTSTGPNFSYTWTGPGISGSNFTLLHPVVSIPGTYTLTVTDLNTNCTASDAVVISQDIVPPSAFVAPPGVLNCIFTTVTLDGSASSSGPQFVYEWSTTNGNIATGANTTHPVVNAPGTYRLIVTDAFNGCTAETTVSVMENILFPTANAGPDTGIPCGGADVTLNASGSSTGAEYAYFWSGAGIFAGNNTLSPIVNLPGEYTLLVTNTLNGCTAVDAVKVFAGPAIPQQNFAVSNLTCTPGQFGAIDMTVDFGAGPYAFEWSNASTTEDINNLAAGTYTVTVTDASGCSHYACVVVAQGSTTLNVAVSNTNPTCFGSSNATISLTVTGGLAPYTYAWTGPSGFVSTLEDVTGLAAGNYAVTVTDAAGCTREAIRNIQYIPASVQISIVNSTCDNNGALNINVIGNLAPPFTFDWSHDGPEDPDNDPEDLTGIGPGTYVVTITAGDGCVLISNAYNVSGPPPLLLSASVTNILCGGAGNDGAIDLSVSGGTPPFSYLWNHNATTADITDLSPGPYTVTVTDAQHCTKTLSATVSFGSEIPGTSFDVTKTSCATGSADGAITLNTLPPAAQAPLTFLWQGPAGFSATTQNITGLAAGDYSITITDATSCPFTATVTVDKVPGDLTINVGNGLLTCTSGTIDITVSGGTAPYTYGWSNTSTQEDLVYSSTGTYTVTVTDATGCTKTSSTTITLPIGLVLNTTPVNINCNGAHDGMINLTVANGTSAYTYTWNTGATTQNLNGLAPGTYCVTVTDTGNGCTASICDLITQPIPMAILNSITPPSCANSTNASFSISLFNSGSGPYAWDLSGPSSQSGSSASGVFNINGLSAGTYCVTITNAEGCTSSSCATLSAPPLLVATIEELSNNCNASVIRVNVTGGVAPYSYSWEGMVTITETTPTIIVPVSGLYQVFVQDAHGCGDFDLFTVSLANGGNCGYIRGSVVQDDNENCLPNATEPGLAGWLVRAEGADTLYGITDATGHYLVGAPTGTYTMAVLPPNSLWIVCPGALPASVDMPNDTAFGGDFPVKKFMQCPLLTVSIGVNQLRRCFSTNYYDITYCNEGTAVAENAYMDVTLDPFLTFYSSNLISQDLGGNVRRFLLGNIAIGHCGSFYIRVTVNCDAVLGQTHCTEAHIFPDTVCDPDSLWSGADLRVRSLCNTDSVRFIIKNVGSGSMGNVVQYIVVEDAVMVMQAPLPLLAANDSIIVSFPANGSTWRVEVPQDAHHPYPQPASLSVEGCTTNNSFSTGFVGQFPTGDPSPAVDIDCTANTGSYDPNDKHSYPIGYGAAHYVRPGTEIEYQIRFQNTGTDTAFTVRVIDTLSSWLDPTTVHFGAASHPYRYDICGEGIVQFIFDNIMLPDSNVNEPASHGFARFAITPRADAPLESVIENSAAIYFDYNEPVITNTTSLRLGENFISVGLWQPRLPDVEVITSPNPFSEETILEIKGLAKNTGLQLHVFDYQGIEIRTISSEDAIFHLKKGSWPAGIYFFRITQHDKTLGTGKLIAQ